MTAQAPGRFEVRLADAASVFVILALIVSGYWVSAHGIAGQIPLHFGFDGRADRWGGRAEVGQGLWLMAGLAGLIAVICVVLERQGDGKAWQSSLRLARGVTALVFAFLGVLFGGLGMGWIGGMGGAGAWAMIVLSLTLVVVGAVMGRARPNPIFGVRTFWTLTSRLSWDKSNRLGGRLMGAIGLIGLFASPFAPQPQAMHWLVVALLVAAGLTVLESWRVWTIDPDRRTGREPTL
ncbi:MAG: hypothetical protein JWP35_503 [Caulobacter sp.]|nr:hypothetical protein [Caulobacter sp.]